MTSIFLKPTDQVPHYVWQTSVETGMKRSGTLNYSLKHVIELYEDTSTNIHHQSILLDEAWLMFGNMR